MYTYEIDVLSYFFNFSTLLNTWAVKYETWKVVFTYTHNSASQDYAFMFYFVILKILWEIKSEVCSKIQVL